MTLTIIAPQFERPSTWPPIGEAPVGLEQWKSLSAMPLDELKKLGLCAWNNPKDEDAVDGEFGGKQLWLIPGAWYKQLPMGLVLTCISGKEEIVKNGYDLFSSPNYIDDDIRFGCLAYGILVSLK